MPKCSDCGFLAVCDEYNDDICEATDFCRDRGQHQSSQGNATRAKAICFLNEPFICVNFDKPNEIPDQLRVEHECNKWVKWRPGRSPQREEEMEALREVQRLDLERRAEQKKWNEALEQNVERRFQKQMDWNASVDRRIVGRHHIAIIVQTLLSLLAAGVALTIAKLFPDYWLK